MTNVLLVDDDAELAGLLSQVLQREGIGLTHLARGAAVVDALLVAVPLPDLVMLDLMLPDIGGLEVFRAIRARFSHLPVIMVTARGDPVDRVIGLEIGADDYVAKPFDSRELVARIRAVLRRQGTKAPADASALAIGDAVFDRAARTVKVGPRSIQLTTIEYRLLDALAAHPGTPMSRDALSAAAQHGRYRPLERAVDVQIGRLRRKLADIAPHAAWIVTVRGQGYLWAPPA